MNRVIHADCRVAMRQLIDEGVRVQCVVTSPPYFGLRDYGHSGQIGLEPSPIEYVAAMTDVFGLVRDLLADDGVLWLNLGDSYSSGGRKTRDPGQSKLHPAFTGEDNAVTSWRPADGAKPKDLLGIPWRVAFALQDAGWYLRQDIIWAKPNPMPESVRDRCTKAHEYLFLMAKSERYYYDADAINERAIYSGKTVSLGEKSLSKGQANGANVAKSGNALVDSVMVKEARNRRSVWTIATQPYAAAHFATMPEALVEPCILAGSRPGDIVFDPFMGSGTVAAVAQRLGRRWLGSELNPDYINLIHERTRGTIGMEFA